MPRTFKPWTPSAVELELLHECWLARLIDLCVPPEAGFRAGDGWGGWRRAGRGKRTILVEHEQRMITGAFVMAVPDAVSAAPQTLGSPRLDAAGFPYPTV